MAFTKEQVKVAVTAKAEKSERKPTESSIDKFSSYCIRLLLEKDRKTQKDKNPWIKNYSAEKLAEKFMEVHDDGLVFNGEDVILQSTGTSYNYQAYKNKLLLAYPETLIDAAIVYKGDKFSFQKVNREVRYTHEIANPFSQKDEDIIGAYCVIKNRRGEFLVHLSPEDINKRRKVAKTDNVWKQWFKEMVLKTVIKKGCARDFKDIFVKIEEEDNKQYDLDKLEEKENREVEMIDGMVGKINACNTLEDLRKLWVGSDSFYKRNPVVLKAKDDRKEQLTDNAEPEPPKEDPATTKETPKEEPKKEGLNKAINHQLGAEPVPEMTNVEVRELGPGGDIADMKWEKATPDNKP